MCKKLLTGLGLLFVLLLLCVSASADGYPESAHPYGDNTDQTWTYTHPTSLDYMKVTFSSDTEFENNYDFLYITDASGSQTRYTGNSLAGKTLYFRGNTITLRLTSGLNSFYGFYNYGFQITSIAAATQAEYEALRYTVKNGTITAFQGAASNLIIPSTIDGQTVTAIGSSVFAYNSSLTSVTLPDGVTSIGGAAFQGCSMLTSVTIPDSVTSIGYDAFRGCSSLTSVTIPNGVTSIDSAVFLGCSSLTSITIPDSVTSIYENSFTDCTSLTSINVDSGNSSYSSLNGVLFNKDKTTLITCPEGFSGAYSIPAGVTGTWLGAFSGCTGLTGITIPDSLTGIGSFTFFGCTSLTRIDVDSGNSSLSSLNGVLFNKDKTTLIICPGGFSGTYSIPVGVTSLVEYAFGSCASLTSITIPDSVTSIGDYAFCECTGLTSITIPDSVTSIGNSAFAACTSLTSVTIPDSVTSIGYFGTFKGCTSLTSVTILNPDTKIGYSAFAGCSPSLVLHGWTGSTAETYAASESLAFEPLAVFALPASLTAIEAEAFQGIRAFAVLIPAGVTDISGNPFADSRVRFIHGVPGTAAETFASAYGYTFVPVSGK